MPHVYLRANKFIYLFNKQLNLGVISVIIKQRELQELHWLFTSAGIFGPNSYRTFASERSFEVVAPALPEAGALWAEATPVQERLGAVSKW